MELVDQYVQTVQSRPFFRCNQSYQQHASFGPMNQYGNDERDFTCLNRFTAFEQKSPHPLCFANAQGKQLKISTIYNFLDHFSQTKIFHIKVQERGKRRTRSASPITSTIPEPERRILCSTETLLHSTGTTMLTEEKHLPRLAYLKYSIVLFVE